MTGLENGHHCTACGVALRGRHRVTCGADACVAARTRQLAPAPAEERGGRFNRPFDLARIHDLFGPAPCRTLDHLIGAVPCDPDAPGAVELGSGRWVAPPLDLCFDGADGADDGGFGPINPEHI